jgi:hypothetical protein
MTTLRDEFAKLYTEAAIDASPESCRFNPKEVATAAYRLADAMIEARIPTDQVDEKRRWFVLGFEASTNNANGENTEHSTAVEVRFQAQLTADEAIEAAFPFTENAKTILNQVEEVAVTKERLRKEVRDNAEADRELNAKLDGCTSDGLKGT